MKSLRLFFLTGFAFVACALQAAGVDSLSVFSNAMKKNVKVVVVSPDKSQSPASVIYLLHGYGGDEKTWVSMKPELKEVSDRDNLIFVCPDGLNSWYWDSPKNPSYRYETFVSNELVKYIDGKYPTRKNRAGRAISGLSMGGHGAMWIALRHKDVFGAVGSTSGGLDVRPFPNNWEMSKQLGIESENQEIWNTHTVINQIDRLENGDLAIIFDCGYSDFFFEVNNDFHNKLLKYKIDHDFLVRPGGHDGNYWRNSMDYQIVFFKKFFDKK